MVFRLNIWHIRSFCFRLDAIKGSPKVPNAFLYRMEDELVCDSKRWLASQDEAIHRRRIQSYNSFTHDDCIDQVQAQLEAGIFAIRDGNVCSIGRDELAVLTRDEFSQVDPVQNIDQPLINATVRTRYKINTINLQRVHRSYDSSNI